MSVRHDPPPRSQRTSVFALNREQATSSKIGDIYRLAASDFANKVGATKEEIVKVRAALRIAEFDAYSTRYVLSLRKLRGRCIYFVLRDTHHDSMNGDEIARTPTEFKFMGKFSLPVNPANGRLYVPRCNDPAVEEIINRKSNAEALAASGKTDSTLVNRREALKRESRTHEADIYRALRHCNRSGVMGRRGQFVRCRFS